MAVVSRLDGGSRRDFSNALYDFLLDPLAAALAPGRHTADSSVVDLMSSLVMLFVGVELTFVCVRGFPSC